MQHCGESGDKFTIQRCTISALNVLCIYARPGFYIPYVWLEFKYVRTMHLYTLLFKISLQNWKINFIHTEVQEKKHCSFLIIEVGTAWVETFFFHEIRECLCSASKWINYLTNKMLRGLERLLKEPYSAHSQPS